MGLLVCHFRLHQWLFSLCICSHTATPLQEVTNVITVGWWWQAGLRGGGGGTTEQKLRLECGQQQQQRAAQLESRHPAARRPSGAAREPTRTTRRQHAAQHVTTLHCSHTLLKEQIFFKTKYFLDENIFFDIYEQQFEFIDDGFSPNVHPCASVK